MSYLRKMEECIAYIEEHIDEAISIAKLADLTGYSLYHFCRVFKSFYGESPGSYIRYLKLNTAADALKHGQSVTDTAFACGYDSISGFTRAFQRKYGISPSEYIKKGEWIMTPEIIKKETFYAVGYCLKPVDDDIDVLENGAFWHGKDFSSVSLEDYQKLTYPGYSEIGTWMYPDTVSGDLYYFFGPSVLSTEFIPEGMEALEFPEAEYAVFTVPAAASAEELCENVKKTWKYIFAEWFDQSDWKYDETKKDFEMYHQEHTYIYVPVIRK